MAIYEKIFRRLRWHFNRAKWKLGAPASPVMVHVGCGSIDAPGYINIDARPLPHIHHVVKDLRDLDFIRPASVDLMYMSHVLEHVGRKEVDSVLRAMAKAIKPGGTLRLAVPDFDLILQIYQGTGGNLDAISSVLMGEQDYRENCHYNAFNRDVLTRLLLRSGFRDVREWDADTSPFDDCAKLPYLYEGVAYKVSLNLEATRQ